MRGVSGGTGAITVAVNTARNSLRTYITSRTTISVLNDHGRFYPGSRPSQVGLSRDRASTHKSSQSMLNQPVRRCHSPRARSPLLSTTSQFSCSEHMLRKRQRLSSLFKQSVPASFNVIQSYSILTLSSVQFTILVAASALYDIIWLARHEQNWLVRILSILILILKVRFYYMHVIQHLTSTQAPTVLAFAAALRQRGTQFSGLSFTGNNLNGATGTLLHVCSTTIT